KLVARWKKAEFRKCIQTTGFLDTGSERDLLRYQRRQPAAFCSSRTLESGKPLLSMSCRLALSISGWQLNSLRAPRPGTQPDHAAAKFSLMYRFYFFCVVRTFSFSSICVTSGLDMNCFQTSPVR